MSKSARTTGFFTMDLANQVAVMKDLEAAKRLCRDAIEAQPGARPENTRKAHAAVGSATSVNKLVLNMGSFIMAHLGMKVIR